MLWQRVMGLDAVPELSADALVADCDPAWHFPGDEAAKDLWTTLRLALLYATWVSRCRSLRDSSVRVQPANIVGTTVAMLKHVIRLDWTTTTLDVRRSTSVCSTWFRSRRPPALTVEEFRGRWCRGELLAEVNCKGSGNTMPHHTNTCGSD